MKQKMIVSNIRVLETYWLQVKSNAAERGMSVNEYINALIWQDIGEQQLGIRVDKKRRSEKQFWDIPKIMTRKKYQPMGASEDDKIIYGIEDG